MELMRGVVVYTWSWYLSRSS